MAEPRFADTKVYHVPDSLDDLRGPATGVIHLPISIFWGPRRDFDIPSAARPAYQAVINEGTPAEQQDFLNRDLLIELWPRLSLPWRAYDMWEARFPELKR